MKRFKIGVVVGLALMMLLNCAAGAQLIQQVPADALLVVQVNNLKSVNDKIAKLAQDLGIAAMLPPAADPLGFLQMQAKMQNGVDTAGNLGIVMLDPTKGNVAADAATQKENAILILIPVTDYKAFLGNWPDAVTTGDVSEVKLGGVDTGYVANWGKYAALSPGKAAVSQKPTASMTAPSASAKELASKDVVLYANFVALRATLGPQLAAARPMALSQVEAAIGRNAQMAKFAAVIKAVVSELFNSADTFLSSTDGATFGLALTPDGINTTLLADFQPKSYLGELASGLTNSSDSLLNGLPKGKYLLYGGSVNSPQVMSKLISDFMDPIVKELLAVGPEMAPVQDYVSAMKAGILANKSGSFGLLAPKGALGTESIVQIVGINRGDAPAAVAAVTKMMTAQRDLMKASGLPGFDVTKMVITPNAKTIDGVNFTSMVTSVEMNAQNPVAMQQAQMMNMLYGPQGQVVLFGITGDSVLTCMGLSDAMVSTAIAAAKSNQSPLADSDNVKAVAAHLPKQRMQVVYFAVGDIATTALGYAKQFGLAVPVQLPPDLPPIGVSMGSEGSAVRIDTHIPTMLVQSLVAASIQAQMNIQGGGGGAGAPGGGL